jgi:hypothetical protein
MKKYFSFVILALFSMSFTAKSAMNKDTIHVIKIWDKGQHNAFTDLIRFKNKFYCSFREGDSHVGRNGGKVRILSSADGKKWQSAALLKIDGVDLRDPKLSVTPDEKIMVIMAGTTHDTNNVVEELYPMVSYSDGTGKSFSLPEKSILDPAIHPSKDWIWRVAWHKGIGYGIDYQLKENGRDRSLLKKDAWVLYLMKTSNGKDFKEVSKLDVLDLPNESTVRFDKNDKAYVLIRREAGDKMGVLAESNFPYNDWKYNKLDFRLGGPNFIFLNKQKLVIGTRIYETVTSTGILVTDLKGKVLKTIKLPGSGDTSYPGMLIYDEQLWVSYYSSHEEKTSIYIARIPVETLY